MPDEDESSPALWVEDALNKITSLIAFDDKNPAPSAEWTQGAAPTSGPSFLIADGYLSRSTSGRRPPYHHVIEHFGPKLRAARPSWPIHGFSYRAPLKHYVKEDTQFNPVIEEYANVRGYAPTEGCQTTFIGYSLGALTMVFGLDLVLSEDDFPVEQLAARCPTLVLCQPAFALGLDVQSHLGQMERADAVTLLAMARRRSEILARVERVLGRLTASSVRVVVVAWQNDKFINLTPDVLDRIQEQGVEVKLVEIDEFKPQANNPFIEHCYVPFQETFLDALHEVVSIPR